MRRAPLVAAAARRLGLITALIALLLLSIAGLLRAQRPLPDQDVLQFLNQTIGWYRDTAALVQSPADSREKLFTDSLRETSAQVLRLAFDFARGQAAIPQANTPGISTVDSGRSRNLAQAEAAATQKTEQAQAEIEELNRQIQNASPRTRAGLVALRDEVTSELNFAKARRDALHNLIGFLSVPGEGGLAAKIGDLERSVPEIANVRQRPAASENTANTRTAVPQDFHPESAGLIALTTEILSLSRKMSQLSHLAQSTEALRQANEGLRGPLRAALQSVIRNGDALAQRPESQDTAALTQQKKELDGLAARFKQISGSTMPLSEQEAQISASRAQLLQWRRTLGQEYSAALRYLLLRVGMLAVGLALILGLSELWRRGTLRYVQDRRRRRQFLLLRRIVVGCAIALFLVLSFVTEFGSLATFAGFSAAGIAVAMQSVILSAVAYFFLVGRWGVRVGDRVTVSGVTGEVMDVGLFRLYLMELGGSDVNLEPTGRVVVFPNAIFFQPAALFKQFPGIDYGWRSITLRLQAVSDSDQVEKRLTAAVASVYGEYRENVERQYQHAQSSMNVHTPPPRVESRLHFADSTLEITIRYPVELGRAGEIEDQISRRVLDAIESEPKLRVAEVPG